MFSRPWANPIPHMHSAVWPTHPQQGYVDEGDTADDVQSIIGAIVLAVRHHKIFKVLGRKARLRTAFNQ
ncbi:MAG: hypothetical protein CMM54_00260 [Rhodospirillaceae bacterium]|nr:hypothetical protein [Rhodospirillaceae bacterium]